MCNIFRVKYKNDRIYLPRARPLFFISFHALIRAILNNEFIHGKKVNPSTLPRYEKRRAPVRGQSRERKKRGKKRQLPERKENHNIYMHYVNLSPIHKRKEDKCVSTAAAAAHASLTQTQRSRLPTLSARRGLFYNTSRPSLPQARTPARLFPLPTTTTPFQLYSTSPSTPVGLRALSSPVRSKEREREREFPSTSKSLHASPAQREGKALSLSLLLSCALQLERTSDDCLTLYIPHA